MGIAAAGASVGGTVFPVAARSLIEQVGWEGCLVALSNFLTLCTREQVPLDDANLRVHLNTQCWLCKSGTDGLSILMISGGDRHALDTGTTTAPIEFSRWPVQLPCFQVGTIYAVLHFCIFRIPWLVYWCVATECYFKLRLIEHLCDIGSIDLYRYQCFLPRDFTQFFIFSRRDCKRKFGSWSMYLWSYV